MIDSDGFAEAILAAPLGVAMLARIEAWAASGNSDAPLGDSTTDGVRAAVDLVGELSIGELVAAVVHSSENDVGPWRSDAAINAAQAYRFAQHRSPIAAAIAEQFGDVLHRPFEADEQQWWTTTNDTQTHQRTPLFNDFERVYDAGQFTWAGLWTVTNPPGIVHGELIDAWEMYPGPISRWRLPARPEARVFEIHRPQDWVRLVTEHPRHAAMSGEYWELPSPNRMMLGVTDLLAIPGQHASRAMVRTHLVPDWRSVATRYDGVHLSWAGLITSEGYISDLPGGDVAMLRYWFSERTHWLADLFAVPELLPGPVVVGGVETELVGATPEVDVARVLRDRGMLETLLGRRPR